MRPTLAAPLLRVKEADRDRKSNTRAIRSGAASGMLESRELLSIRAHPGIPPGVVSGSPPSLKKHGGPPAPVTSLKKGADRRGRPSHRPWRARAQPEERLARPASGLAHRLHGSVRVGQVVPGLRHHLRGGPAALRGVALLVRPAVPRPDGQAGRRLHRGGAVPGGLHRPEVDLAQPALHGRHDHRGLRLPAAALRAHRQAALPRVRPPPSRASRRRPSSTRCWSCRRAAASRCSRRWCANARASSSTCSPTCRPRATPARAWTARRSSSPARPR